MVSGIFDLERTLYSIRYFYPTSYSGQEHIIIYLRNVKRGIWKIILEGVYINQGRYNAYLENKVFLNKGTKFKESIPNYTINYPSVQQDVINIGTYNSITKSVWASSSRGPSIIQRLKPDVVAPGVDILSTYPDNQFAVLSGTSMAAPHVSGSLALLKNWSKEEFKRDLNSKELYAQLVKHTKLLQYSRAVQGNGLVYLAQTKIKGKIKY